MREAYLNGDDVVLLAFNKAEWQSVLTALQYLQRNGTKGEMQLCNTGRRVMARVVEAIERYK